MVYFSSNASKKMNDLFLILSVFIDADSRSGLGPVFFGRKRKPSIIRKERKFPDYRGFSVPVDENGYWI